MDGKQFDDLLREWSSTRLSRLSALRGLIAGAATAVTGASLGLAETDAKSKKKGKGKNHKKSKSHKKDKSRAGKQVAVSCPSNTKSVTYTGQGLTCSGSDCQLKSVECDANNSPYVLFVLTATGASSATISINGGSAQTMTKKGNGAFQYKYTGLTSCADLSSLISSVYACYTGTSTNPQLVISHGCCCTPKTCEELGFECGSQTDNCGNPIDCGECTECPNSYCDDNGQCQCDADTCESLDKQCGDWDNGCCGTTGDCGTCDECPNSYCNDNGHCKCDPDTCADLGKECDSWDDGCCGNVDCGTCTECDNSYCDNDGQCQCEKNVCQPGQCGQVPDGCCGFLDCGPCFCGHSVGTNGGCKGACTSVGGACNGNRCEAICAGVDACPTGQGGNNPCCNPGYCEPSNFKSSGTPMSGTCTYTGPACS
jgi:hypothetical protein